MGRGHKVTLKHVHSFKDRHGKVRHYLRLPGVPSVALKGDPGSPEFMRAYYAAIDSYRPAAPSVSKVKPYSMNDLAERYWRTTPFMSKSERTRYVERQQIGRFLKTYGDLNARAATAANLDKVLAKMADRPAAAMDLRKRLRLLFRLAIKLDWRKDNPIDATDTMRTGTHHTWTEDEIAAFQAHWPRGTMRRTAFDLLLYTGQRSGDVRIMTWPDVAGGRFRVVAQQKTGQSVSAPLHPDLIETLQATPRDHMVIVATQTGKAFSAAGFGNWMADAIANAGLPAKCRTHGIRKAAARRLAEAGCTAHMIKSITGHKSLKEVERYTDAYDREQSADEAMKRMVDNLFANPIRKPEKKA